MLHLTYLKMTFIIFFFKICELVIPLCIFYCQIEEEFLKALVFEVYDEKMIMLTVNMKDEINLLL
jgi:hypothetical protein